LTPGPFWVLGVVLKGDKSPTATHSSYMMHCLHKEHLYVMTRTEVIILIWLCLSQTRRCYQPEIVCVWTSLLHAAIRQIGLHAEYDQNMNYSARNCRSCRF
jgi:hypothetical protein